MGAVVTSELVEDDPVLLSEEKDREEMKRIYEQDIAQHPPSKSFLLFYAAAEGDLERVKALVSEIGSDGIRGYKPHAIHGGMTPLHIAALSGSKDVCEFLVSANASVTARDDANKTPDQYAEDAGYPELARFMRLKWLSTRDPAIDSLEKYAKASDEFLLEWERRQWEDDERKRIKASQPPKPKFIKPDKMLVKSCKGAACKQNLSNRLPEYHGSIHDSHFSGTRKVGHFSLAAKAIERTTTGDVSS